jgi:hypothetical protein
VPAPPAKKKNQKTKFLGLTVDGRVRMLRSFARRREKYIGCENLTKEPLRTENPAHIFIKVFGYSGRYGHRKGLKT